MTRRKASTSTGRTRTVSTRTALIKGLGKLIALLLVLGLVLLLNHYCSIQPEPFGPDAKIVSIDGDTLRAGNGAEYRLYAIDAPELKQTCQEQSGKTWRCGRSAKARLTTLIKGGEVTCQERDKDRYGRIVAVCSAAGVADLGEAMVLKGYAIALDMAGARPYAGAEAEAQAENRGIWRGQFQRPSDWRQAHPRTN
jgi:endonuclease YncB( thermonuclease family)